MIESPSRPPRILVRHQIMLAVGALMALGLGAMLALAIQLRMVAAQLEDLAKVTTPLSAAAFEMEINMLGAGLGVMKYLDNPDPAHRRRVEEDESEFARFKAQFDRLARSEEKRRMGREVETLHREFIALGESLMARQDELEARLTRFAKTTTQLDATLERAVDRGANFAASRVEAWVAEISQRLTYYTKTRDVAHLATIEQEERTLLAALSGPQAGRAAGRWRAAAKPLVDASLADLRAIVRLQQARDRDIPHFIELRRRLDNLLDEGIQRLVAQRVAAAQEAAAASVERTLIITIVLGLSMLAFGPLVARRLVRALVIPLRRLTEGAAILGAGNMAHRIECGRGNEFGNEFGELARDFNRMAGLLQQYMMQLRESNELLEQRVAARTAELAHQAGHDPLTGLANRTRIHQFMDDAIKAARRRGEMFALLLLDLDSFKDVNDSLGHDSGDRLLREVARRLQEQVREGDMAARLGGDEFCLLLRDIDDAEQAAEVAQRCLDALAEPLALKGMAIGVRGSIGIALYPDDAGETNALLMAADTAMYAAKHGGKHRYAFYDNNMTQAVDQRLALESALRGALVRGEFELHYQPQVSLESGRMRGVEALVRWRHPERGLVPPDAFIAVAERLDLMVALGNWVLETACRQAVAWQRAGLEAPGMAVNISPSHFEAPGFADSVARVVRDSGIAPALLEIEVTESISRNLERHTAICLALQRLGVRVAIDDFGTGYSSLSVLNQMPIDTLKLDQKFIHDMLGGARSSVMIGTLLGMAKSLELAVVAEGVETLEQVQILKGFGCPLAQGYYFSRPVPAAQIPALARTVFLERVADGLASEARALLAARRG
jgi:diguanylate cyclase (GGDEF)-like protein